MPSAIFHCKYCGKKYRTTKESILNSSHRLQCNNCGKETNVVFFDCCPNCHENVDFYDNGMLEYGVSDILTDMGSSFIKGITNPFGAVTDTINNFKAIFSNGAGICPICNKRFVRCAKCNELTEIPFTTKTLDIVTCRYCGQTLNPSEIKEGKGADHSLEYYKVGM